MKPDTMTSERDYSEMTSEELRYEMDEIDDELKERDYNAE